jgi:hydroxyethylthiazole kinase-like uncharacterized protein yjeF
MIPIDKGLIRSIFRPRRHDASKWDNGHALIFSGSRGKVGASILASKACLRSGAGLVTVHVPRCSEIPIHSVLPEAMLSLDIDNELITEIPIFNKFDAIGFGPGVGRAKKTELAFHRLLETLMLPIVIDADGLNMLASLPTFQFQNPNEVILTPHHREFERLIGRSWRNDCELYKIAQNYSVEKKSILVLKSSETRVYSPNGSCYIAVNGNAGLAKGGTGDVLLGILTGLLAQGYTTLDTALLGVYLHGRAADIALKSMAMESINASDVIDHISNVFKELSLD